MKLSLNRVAEFTQGTGNFEAAAIAEGYSIDTRSLRSGELFFAIKVSGWMAMTTWKPRCKRVP